MTVPNAHHTPCYITPKNTEQQEAGNYRRGGATLPPTVPLFVATHGPNMAGHHFSTRRRQCAVLRQDAAAMNEMRATW